MTRCTRGSQINTRLRGIYWQLKQVVFKGNDLHEPRKLIHTPAKSVKNETKTYDHIAQNMKYAVL